MINKTTYMAKQYSSVKYSYTTSNITVNGETPEEIIENLLAKHAITTHQALVLLKAIGSPTTEIPSYPIDSWVMSEPDIPIWRDYNTTGQSPETFKDTTIC